MKYYFSLIILILSTLQLEAQKLNRMEYCGLCQHELDWTEEEPSASAHRKADAGEWKPTYEIDFMAAFDPRGKKWAEDHCGTIQAYAEYVVDKMNYVMRNSELDACFKLVGTFVISETVPEITKGPGMCLNSMPLREEAARLRVDICLLFADPEGPVQPETGNAFYAPLPGDGYGCVLASSGYDANTAVHEAGHIMGCAHARDVDQNNPHPYNAGAMRWIDGVQYSTVMGYHGVLLPHFSDPNYIYKGTAMGSETENNVRRIRERLPEIVRMGEPITHFELSPTEWNPDYKAQTLEVQLRNDRRPYNISSDVSWLSVSRSVGYTADPLTVTVTANTTGKTRVGHITVSDYDKKDPSYADVVIGDGVLTVTQFPEGGTIIEPTEPKDAISIAEAQKAAGGTMATIVGTVMATHREGAVIGDATGYIHLYNMDHGLKEGDYISLSGHLDKWYGFSQYTYDAKATLLKETTPTLPTPRVLTGSDVTSWISKPSIEYIRATGTLYSTDDVWIQVPNSGINMINLISPKEDMLKGFSKGQEVTVTGFAMYSSDGRFVNVVATRLTQGTEPDPKPEPEPEPETLKGDVNGDKKVDVGDLTALVSFILGTETKEMNRKAADLNGDDKILVDDYTLLVNIILKGE